MAFEAVPGVAVPFVGHGWVCSVWAGVHVVGLLGVVLVVGFRRSSRCSKGGCVWVGSLPGGGVGVAGSGQPVVLRVAGSQWGVFLAGVKAAGFGGV